MKQIYVCEKCGKQFDTWQRANACEEAHVLVFEADPEWNETYEYDEGVEFPNEVIVRHKEWNWRTGENEYRYWKYKSAGRITKKLEAELEEKRKQAETEAEAAYKKLVAEREKELAGEQEQEVVG